MKVQIEVHSGTELVSIHAEPDDATSQQILFAIMLGIDLYANTTLIHAMNLDIDPDLRATCKEIYQTLMRYGKNYEQKHGRHI